MSTPANIVNGIPTEPDVKALIAAFGIPNRGDVIAYTAIEEVIEVKWRDGGRFKTVTTAWRKKLEREHNLFSKCTPGKAFRFLPANECPDYQRTAVNRGVKSFTRAVVIAARTPVTELSPNNRAQMEHQTLLSTRTLQYVHSLDGRMAPVPPKTSISGSILPEAEVRNANPSN